jgi:protein SCO1/2
MKKALVVRLSLFLVIFFAGVIIGSEIIKKGKKLPIYNPSQLNPRLVDESLRNKTHGHTVSDFKLVNQLGDTITHQKLENKIYVANFFFATCQTICPKMNGNLLQVQEAYKNDEHVQILSFSVTPQIDSVSVLHHYALQMGIDSSKWYLLTGDKKQIYNLARKSYFAVLDEGDGGVQDFIHTENVILVDPKRRIRGYYDGTSKEDIEQLIEDIEILEQEFAFD